MPLLDRRQEMRGKRDGECNKGLWPDVNQGCCSFTLGTLTLKPPGQPRYSGVYKPGAFIHMFECVIDS